MEIKISLKMKNTSITMRVADQLGNFIKSRDLLHNRKLHTLYISKSPVKGHNDYL